MQSIGIFGGAFDPIHIGHLRTAFELMAALTLNAVHFVPSAIPPHKHRPQAGGDIRLRMINAAIQGQAGFVADERELNRPGPSYSVDTLVSLRQEYPDDALCLLIGMDAFLGMGEWHRWQEIPALAHIVVAHRPGWSPARVGLIGDLLASRGATRAADLKEARSGRIYIQEVTQLEISSGDVRDLIGRGGNPRYLLPRAVVRIIKQTGCYRQPQESLGTKERNHA